MSIDTSVRPAVRGLLSLVLLGVGVVGIPFGCLGSIMNERPADKAVNNLLMLVGIVSLIASIGLGRKSTWSRAAGGTAACSVALFGIVLAFASSDKNTMAGALLIAILFMTIGALVYLAAHYATSVNEVRESGAESIEQRTP